MPRRQGHLFVALRNLNVVFCFSSGGDALLWKLAATDELSDFAFERDIDKVHTRTNMLCISLPIARTNDERAREGPNRVETEGPPQYIAPGGGIHGILVVE